MSVLDRGQRILAVVLAGALFLAQLAGVSPELHAWLHAESAVGTDHGCTHDDAPGAPDDETPFPKSDSDGHRCVVSLLATGVTLVAATALHGPPVAGLDSLNVVAEVRLIRVFMDRARARAPPESIAG